MPRGFAVPEKTEVWATARPFRPVAETAPVDFYVYLVGRLTPGATVEQSGTELTHFLRRNDTLLPNVLSGMTASAKALDDDLLGEARPVIRLLLMASAPRAVRRDRQRRRAVPRARARHDGMNWPCGCRSAPLRSACSSWR